MEEKKKKKSTKKEEKKEVKKVVKKEIKKEETAVPNPEPFGVRFKSFIASYKFLYTAFGILFVLVLLLACMVFVKGNEVDKTNSNIVFSILEKNTNNYLDLDLETLVGKEYTLKVTNYRQNRINKDKSHYVITVINDTEVEMEVTIDKYDENLMTDQKRSVMEGDFGNKEKEEHIYTFKVKNSDNIKKGDKIRIEVES